MKKCFKKFKNFLENKSNPFYFVCYESIIDNINHNTRWVGYGYNLYL